MDHSGGILRRTFRDITDRLSVPLERVAEVTGRFYATILAYRHGSRDAPPEVYVHLAKLAREQGGELVKLAEELQE